LARLQAGESAAVAIELSEMHPADAAEVLNELGHSGMLAVLALPPLHIIPALVLAIPGLLAMIGGSSTPDA
jgi:hypothetical protein